MTLGCVYLQRDASVVSMLDATIALIQGNLETLAYSLGTWNIKTVGEVLVKERKFWLDV